MVEYDDSDRDEGRTLKPSSTCWPKQRVTYKCESRSRSESDGDAYETLHSSSTSRSRPACARSSSTERRPASTVSTSKLCQQTLNDGNCSLETDENRVIRTAVSLVHAGEKVVIIYTTEVEEDSTRAVDADTSSVIESDDVMSSPMTGRESESVASTAPLWETATDPNGWINTLVKKHILTSDDVVYIQDPEQSQHRARNEGAISRDCHKPSITRREKEALWRAAT